MQPGFGGARRHKARPVVGDTLVNPPCRGPPRAVAGGPSLVKTETKLGDGRSATGSQSQVNLENSRCLCGGSQSDANRSENAEDGSRRWEIEMALSHHAEKAAVAGGMAAVVQPLMQGGRGRSGGQKQEGRGQERGESRPGQAFDAMPKPLQDLSSMTSGAAERKVGFWGILVVVSSGKRFPRRRSRNCQKRQVVLFGDGGHLSCWEAKTWCLRTLTWKENDPWPWSRVGGAQKGFKVTPCLPPVGNWTPKWTPFWTPNE